MTFTPGMQGPMRSSPPPSPAELALNNHCPRCMGSNVEQPSFTWWGGALGPKLFNHRVCRQCDYGFNGETGLPNRNKVIAYTVIVNAIALVLVVAFFFR